MTNTNTKRYWVQTGKLFLTFFGFNVLMVAAVFSNIPVELYNLLGVIIGIAAIFITVRLYQGFGFWKGLGGYILAKLPFAVMDTMLAFSNITEVS